MGPAAIMMGLDFLQSPMQVGRAQQNQPVKAFSDFGDLTLGFPPAPSDVKPNQTLFYSQAVGFIETYRLYFLRGLARSPKSPYFSEGPLTDFIF